MYIYISIDIDTDSGRQHLGIGTKCMYVLHAKGKQPILFNTNQWKRSHLSKQNHFSTPTLIQLRDANLSEFLHVNCLTLGRRLGGFNALSEILSLQFLLLLLLLLLLTADASEREATCYVSTCRAVFPVQCVSICVSHRQRSYFPSLSTPQHL